MADLGGCFKNRPRELALLALPEVTEATEAAGWELLGASARSIADHSRALAIVFDIFPLSCVALASKDMWETFLTLRPMMATEICIRQRVFKDLRFWHRR